MKKFVNRLLKFFLFFSLTFILLIFIIVFMNRLSLNKCELRNDVTSIIIGDSHTMWSIDASEIKHVQNVSLNAESYIYTYAKLEHLLKSEPNVSKIYLGMSFHNLAGYYNDYIYGRYLKFLFHRYIGVLDLKDYLLLIRHNPKNILWISIEILRNGSTNLLKSECPVYGSFPDEKMTEELDHEQMQKRVKEQFYKDGEVIPVSEINELYLNKIVELCRQKNIQITILSTPLHPDYKKLIPEKYVSLYLQFIRENNLEVYDFNDLALPDSCYLPDGDHVNYEGARKTTQKFKEYHENKIAKK